MWDRLRAAEAAALLGSLAGFAISLVIQRIIDGPVHAGDRSRLLLLVGGVLAQVELRMRGDLYTHLQRLR
ncbi:MAG: hypothetical protein M3R63_13165 [Actinomycetota bacterium]|nr:hypothetical protein [Actinomycetota bacterium]